MGGMGVMGSMGIITPIIPMTPIPPILKRNKKAGLTAGLVFFESLLPYVSKSFSSVMNSFKSLNWR
jgi:hypothetical protein